MSRTNVEERLRALREQAQRREAQPDAWPRLQRRLRREPWRRAAMVAGLALAVLVVSVVPGLLARRTEQPPVPTVGTPVVPGRPVVAARIRLDRPFTDVDVGFGATWVAGQDALLRIDPRTNRLLSPVEVPNMPGAIRYGLDAIWVTSRFTVSRIDPRSGTVTQPLHRVGNVMAVGGGSLWGTFANSADDAGVQQVDSDTGRVVATITIPYGVVMAFGLGTLWVAQDASTTVGTPDEPDRTKPGKLYRIDPTSNRVLGQPVSLPGIAPTALAVGEGAVWVGELDRKTLTRFNLVP